MILKIYTLLHVLISLTGIFSGLVVLSGLLTAKQFNRWTACFLMTTGLTSVTGFLFPYHGVTPGIVTGIISLAVLSLAIFARYWRNLVGAWRKTYVISALLALYLNVFVLIVQSFQKIPALKSIAPTQTEPAFKLTQLLVLMIFAAVTVVAAIRFKEKPFQTTKPLRNAINQQNYEQHT
jgi:hypothetical protein